MVCNINTAPISSLSNESRCLLSCLLNPLKILPTEGPVKLTRDWRGLATLVNISSEMGANICQREDKTCKVLTIWAQQDSSATIGRLLAYLQALDRYDVCDDLMELAKNGRLIDNRMNQLAVVPQVPQIEAEDPDLLTYDDKLHGTPTLYNALVLFAEEDRHFADELRAEMHSRGLRVCTLDDMQAGTTTQYAPASRLIMERCYRIILVYSPEFLRSPANTFYMDYAQAVGIELKQRKILPLMYRECQLPTHHTFYHKLYYTPPGQKAAYNLWERLQIALEFTPTNNNLSTSHSSIRIAELTNGSMSNGQTSSGKMGHFLPLPGIQIQSVSCEALDSLLKVSSNQDDTQSVSSESQISAKLKKTSTFKKIFYSLTGKKHKKAILVHN